MMKGASLETKHHEELLGMAPAMAGILGWTITYIRTRSTRKADARKNNGGDAQKRR